MDAYEIANKVQKYWAALWQPNSGEIPKRNLAIKVCVMTDEGLREVIGVHIVDNYIQLELDKE